ncbi:hypothetical protein BRD00_12775 [Halobacteriales archaeon QS_8_69_26]|nr:MAG: hypothetical protein BRD00_12775 [Halobacteriales archaeon QS_8_69_26]
MAPVPLRETLAAVLGVALGLVLIAYPEAVVRVHTVGRVPGNRRGEYGDDATIPDTWRWAVRVAGVACVAVGLFVGIRLVV